MTQWYWVRHGPTHQRAFCGWNDVPADLSDTARIARLHASLPRDALLVSSDLIRAVATADRLAAGRSRLPDAPDLREFHFGAWEGVGFAEAAARDPDLSRAFWDRPGDAAPPGGESWNMLAARIGRFVSAANTRFPDRSIVAVAHFGVILTQVQLALGISAAEALQYEIANLSMTVLGHEAGRWSVAAINHVP